MRGFRASRAAQNFKSAHFGKPTHQGPTNASHQGANSTQQQEKRPLPDWLKIHETPLEARTKTVATKTVSTKAKPNLRIVRAGGKVALPKSTITTKVVTTTKVRTRSATVPTRKRKAA